MIVDRADWDRIAADGGGLLVVEGERLLYVDSTAGTTGWRWRRLGADGRWEATADDLPDLDEFTDSSLRELKQSPRLRPPPEWVEAAKPCETCRGHQGSIEADFWDLDDPNNHLGWLPCPDCHNGQRIVTVQVECDCGPMRGSVTIYNAGTSDAWVHEQDCPRCDGSGLVTVGHVTVTSGPEPTDDGRFKVYVEVVS